ncbi:UNVERIFIED_CONTAM: hypothetical protein GTU68_061443 [Idotea baltica]|nr:hypothetical protein [Idotea baltica]
MTENRQTITKKELVNRIAEETGQTKVVVKNILQSFLDEIVEELVQGNRLEFREFGVFEVRQRASRKAQNPRTMEKVTVPAKRVVKFKVGRTMRERVCGEEGAAAQEVKAAPRPKVTKVDPTPVNPPPTPPASNSPF